MAGVCLGLLILVKAIFFYLFILLVLCIPAIVYLNYKNKTMPYLRAFSLTLIATTVIIGPWLARNYISLDKFEIRGGGGAGILAIRAEFSTMSWKEYAASFVQFTPAVGPKLVESLFGKDIAEKFNRSNPNGYYARGNLRSGEAKELATRLNISYKQASFKIIKENWIKHILLCIPFAYRGAIVSTGFSGKKAPLFIILGTALVSIFFFPAFVWTTIRAATHYIPRY